MAKSKLFNAASRTKWEAKFTSEPFSSVFKTSTISGGVLIGCLGNFVGLDIKLPNMISMLSIVLSALK